MTRCWMAVDVLQMAPSDVLRLELIPEGTTPYTFEAAPQKQLWNHSLALSDRRSKKCSRYAAPVSIV